ncbi:MAG: MarR family transcriptional regulator [Microbacteriaceae bacterium]
MANNIRAQAQGSPKVTHPNSEGSPSVESSLYDVNASDPNGLLVDRSELGTEDVAQITRLMNSMANLRRAEDELSKASQKFMQLSETEMRAIHFLIVAANQKQIVTPGAISRHLGITSASTTKLLDRLERDEHIVRSPHPTDRRALSISVSEQTHSVARDTVGRTQANRFIVAALLQPEEREVVTRFLNEIAERMRQGHEAWTVAEDVH